MRGADVLIPVRFLSLLSHFCVLITLLWESKQSVHHCLPSQYHHSYFQIYHSRLVAGFAASIALIVVEFITFIFGLTMFSPSVAMTSIAGHGSASIVLTYFVLDGWMCDWFWPIFFFSSVVPFSVDIVADEAECLTQPHGYKAGWSLYLVLAGFITTLGSSLPVGYNIGVVNMPAVVIKEFLNESFVIRYDVKLETSSMNLVWAFVVSIFIIGGCTGSIIGSVLADKFGRKKATIITSALFIAGACMFFFCRMANSVEMLIVGRLLVGLASGLTTSIVPMYLTELSPPALTGPMGAACPMGVNVGVLVGQVMGLDAILGGADNWPYLLAFFALLVIICLPVLCILPESPKYLYVVKKDEAAAIRELSRLRGVSSSVLTEDLELLRDEAQAELSGGSESWGMLRVMRDPRLRLALLLTCAMQAGQQTSGINAVFYYSTTIFCTAGLSETQAQYATIGCGAINVATALVLLRLLPRTGRRPLMLGSTLIAAVLLAALAASLTFIEMMQGMAYVCMAAMMLYVLVYGFGLGPIPYFIASEMFEVAPRGAAMAWGSLSNWGGNFLVGMCFPAMRGAIGSASFLVFAGITTALYIFLRFYFPETRGRSPAQVTQLCGRGFRSRPLRASACA